MAPDPTTARLAMLPALAPAFFSRSALAVAPQLLGKGLVVGRGRQALVVEIVEVEAYMGKDDPASHAYPGETLRNRSMFRRGGTCYVYLSYGVHHCMNVVTAAAGVGQGVLLRAAAPVAGLPWMAKNRGMDIEALSARQTRHVLNGPGKLTQALGLGLTHDGTTYDQKDFKLVDLGRRYTARHIGTSPRIGISKNAAAPWRFFVKDSPWLSR